MNILFLSDVPLRNPTSGSEQVLYNQANGLRSEKSTICALTRINKTTQTGLFDERGVREGRYGADTDSTFKFLLSVFKNTGILFKKLSEHIEFHVVINHQPFTAFALLISGRIKTIPMIYVFHSPGFEEYLILNNRKAGLGFSIQTWARKIIEGYCLHRAKKIMVLSQFMKDKVISLFGIDPDNIEINPGGVDLKRFKIRDDRFSLKEKLNLSKNRVNLLTIRNLEPRMGLDNLLKCISILKEKMPDVYLTIGGNGEEKDRLESQIYENNLQEYVTMTGYIPDEILPEYYAAADFFIIPTRELEGFGLVTPESMACGTPVMGTPIGGTKEILSGFDSEFLFNDITPVAMADGIIRIVEKYYGNNSYKILRSRCREYAEKNYSWDRHIDQLKSIIKEVVS